MQVVDLLQKFDAVALLELQVCQNNVNRRMFENFQGLFGSGHAEGLHPALLGDRCTGLADRLLVIHDENVHRDNLAADCCFLGHNRHPKSLRSAPLSASQVPFQEFSGLFINRYISKKTMSLASPILGLRAAPPSHPVPIRDGTAKIMPATRPKQRSGVPDNLSEEPAGLISSFHFHGQ